MTTSPLLRKIALLLMLVLSIGLVQWSVHTTGWRAAAQDSPLPTPWPTQVIEYQPQVPTITPMLEPTATAADADLLLRSPLPTPTATAIPDDEPPQTSVLISGTAHSSDWYRTPVSLTFAITDNLGVGVTQYQLDAAPDWTRREYYYPPLVLADEGVHQLAFYSIDRARNQEIAQDTQIRIDRTPPQVAEPVVVGNQLRNGWYNTPVTVTLHGDDALSGLAGFETASTAATPSDWAAGAASTYITATTQQTLTWRAVDVAGNVSAAQQVALQVDLTPPTTTHTVAPLPAGGWYTTPVTITLHAVDVGAGLFQSQYRLDPAPEWQIYAAPFRVQSDGLHTVHYQSSDRALNVEPSHAFTLSLDLTPPHLTITRAPTPTTGAWYTGPVTITLSANDDGSGVAALRYSQDDGNSWTAYSAPFQIAPTRLQPLHVTAQDHAGHIRRAEIVLGVDRQSPTTTLQLSHAPMTSSWYTQPLTLTLIATDTETGLLQTVYQWADSDPATYQQPLALTEQGQRTLTWFSQDRALNEEAPHTTTFALDWTPPTITATVDGQAIAPGWYRPGATVVVSATDALSGVSQIDYAQNAAPWHPYIAPLSPPLDPGATSTHQAHIYHLRATDAAGNRATLTMTLGIDTQPPTTTLHLSQPPNAAGWHNAPLTLTLVATDTGSGVFQTQTQWPHESTPTLYQQPLRLAQEGVTTLTWFSIDRTLNAEAPHTTTLSLDWTPPAITYTLQGDSMAPGWYRSAVGIAITATDALAGVTAIDYAVADGPWLPYSTTLTLDGSGQQTLRLRAQDAADNTRVITTTLFGVDTLSPRSTIALAGVAADSGWYRTPVTVTLTATDTEAGLDTIHWRLNGGPWYEYTKPFVVTSERVNLLDYYAVDLAGNAEDAHYQVFSIDLGDPTSSVETSDDGLRKGGTWYAAPVTVTLNAQDFESNIELIEYTLGKGAWQPYAAPLVIANEGIHTLHYRAVDSGGRIEATRTLTVSLDLTPPLITTTTPTTVTALLAPGALDITTLYTATDSLSGILTTTVTLDGEPYAPGQPLSPGSHSVVFSAANHAGLTSQRTLDLVVVGGRFYLPYIPSE